MEDAYREIDGIKIHYTVKGEGRPLVFVHGILFDASGYARLIELLSREYTVYAIDLPMHGKSGRPVRYLSLENLAGVLRKFVLKENLKRPVIAGHSAGGLVAAVYAARYDAAELLLLDPGVVKQYRSLAPLLVKLFLVKPFTSARWNLRAMLRVSLIGGRNLWRNLFNSDYWRLVRDVLDEDHDKVLKKISCPTWILWGAHDEILPYRKAVHVQKLVKNSVLIRIEGNHDWPILRPEEIALYLGRRKAK